MAEQTTILPSSNWNVGWALGAGSSRWEACRSDDGDTSYIYKVGDVISDQIFEMDDLGLPAGVMTDNVRIYMKCKHGSGSAPEVRTAVVIGTSYHYGTAETLTSNWTDYFTDHILNPETGKKWTRSELDGVRMGLESVAGQTTTKACTQIRGIITWRLMNPIRMYHRRRAA